MDKTPIFEETQDYTNQEYFVDVNDQEDVVIPKVLAEEVHSPITDPVTKKKQNIRKKSKS